MCLEKLELLDMIPLLLPRNTYWVWNDWNSRKGHQGCLVGTENKKETKYIEHEEHSEPI